VHSREARLVVPLSERASLDRFLDEQFQELTELVKGLAVLGELTPRSIDAISSYGERLSSFIVTLAFRHFGMKAEHLDSRDVIVTDRRHTHAAPLFSETYARLAKTIPPLTENAVVVMGGFIGSTEDGVTTTLGRGGSDFTASIVGAGIQAEEIQIWTDVDGMLTADPTILPGGHRVKTISFAEAAELAYFGAKVLKSPARASSPKRCVVAMWSSPSPASAESRWSAFTPRACSWRTVSFIASSKSSTVSKPPSIWSPLPK
jgi:aspartate kinase